MVNRVSPPSCLFDVLRRRFTLDRTCQHVDLVSFPWRFFFSLHFIFYISDPLTLKRQHCSSVSVPFRTNKPVSGFLKPWLEPVQGQDLDHYLVQEFDRNIQDLVSLWFQRKLKIVGCHMDTKIWGLHQKLSKLQGIQQLFVSRIKKNWQIESHKLRIEQGEQRGWVRSWPAHILDLNCSISSSSVCNLTPASPAQEKRHSMYREPQ